MPYVICRRDSEDIEEIFDKELFTYKSFEEIKSLSRREMIYQRYIMSRNLKAMVMRFCYHTGSNESNKSNFLSRYQNINPIFKHQQISNTYETSIPLSTISPSDTQ